ncbi:cell wall-binding repeat-containing protein [Planococcus sp. X10-3]|uniref:cell wall-binding repeat-containing protein n=1 Tax=Planococcus sp. X10-3 TaxID=3061240 RepID=UPI003BAFE728
MSKKIFSTVTAAALAISAFGVQTVSADEHGFDLTIMHTNDTHANLENAPKRATLINNIRAEKANNLLLDAGDVFSGTLYFNQFEGEADLALMNYMQYDAMTFGNHEFDLGSSAEGHAALAEFVGNADFPMVGANVDFSADANMSGLVNADAYTFTAANGEIYSGFVKEVGGENVGIFGLTTAETADISSPGDVVFTDYIEAAQEAVDWFEANDVNKIVALTHIGYNDNATVDNDQELAKAVPEIDIIVGGHTHTELLPPTQIGTTVLVQAHEYNKVLGQLDVTFNDAGVITAFAGEHHNVAEAAVDQGAADILEPFTAEVKELEATEIGVDAGVFLNGTRGENGIRASETNLGNFITDGMLAAAKEIDADTTIALQNGGGIRASIEEGPITYGEVLTVLPFGNALAIMKVTGAEIRDALEHSVRLFPAENGGFLHASGLIFNYDGSATAGERVLSVYVQTEEGVEELVDSETYTVATNTFTAKGGDGFDMFGAAYEDGRVTEPGNIDFEMFVNHAQSFGTVIEPTEEGRIKQVRLSGADRYATSVAISKEGWESSKVVVIARGDDFADALTATPLAYQQDAPILLTRSNRLDANVKAEIQRLGAEKAIILGGTSAISNTVLNEIKGNLAGLQATERIGGKDRYETSKKIASRLGGNSDAAVVVSGLNYPDALSASSFAAVEEMPILLTRPDRIPAYTQEALKNIASTLVVGGTVAVSEDVERKLPNAARISGADRYETSAEIANEFFLETGLAFVASGRGFADALTGSNLAANYQAPMLLVKPNAVPASVDQLATQYWTVYIAGGTLAVSPEVAKALHQ